MKNLEKFEDFVKEDQEYKYLNNKYGQAAGSNKKDVINLLCNCQDVYNRHDLESMNIDQLRNLASDIEEDRDLKSDHQEETNELEYESRKWIQDAIKKPGSLRRKLHKKRGERISNTELDSELQVLRARDKNKLKPGLQLNKRDRSKQKQIVLAKTLRGMR